VPVNLRKFLLTRFHTLPVSGRKGRDKTQTAVSRLYHWPDLNRDVARWMKACPTCVARKTPRPLDSGRPASVSEAARPWESISIDFITAGTSSKSIATSTYILTVMCLFTKYVIAVPLTSKRATVVAEALFTHVFVTHGIPKTVHSDEGKEFVNAALLRLYQQWGIQPVLTGGYRPLGQPSGTIPQIPQLLYDDVIHCFW
jgi:transposase InsO family protein